MPTTSPPPNRRQLLRSVESLRGRVCQILNCVINLHIEFLVLESNVAALLDEVRCLNDDYAEVQRLDQLIEALRDYGGPTICHEWPYPLIFKGTIDEAHVAQILNTTELVPEPSPTTVSAKNELLKQTEGSELAGLSRRSKLWRFTRTRSAARKTEEASAS
ncbi:PREDICTED: uncharacterized protein LOC108614671 [Drosophila arizonae]|uniref:Uncharacterized protein LOC108614671 n=1 Tax=Drosophila arizonae TaxID=7263 RepID=A0ABM1PAZ9_DROAR|nr:PREDICTED: uncharacterized protein LOC108614671 [Drosophila arizonae]